MMLLSNSRSLLGLLAVGLVAVTGHHDEAPDHGDIEPTCTANITETVWNEVTVDYTVTNTTLECVTESITTTLLFTVDITETDYTTLTLTNSTTITTTDTDATTVTTTDTDAVTVTTTDTDATTVTTTDTTYTTTTILQTKVDPCPTTCKVDVDTVNLYFWPSDRPYTYPSTHYDEVLDYTFTSPSVYMLIPTASGTNSLGPAGPSTTSWILALDLEEVSTIVDGTITSQLDLADLGTDCPKSRNPTEIATLVDSACAPILAAPTAVSSWAQPCNACGRFGLFDPPYAVPTLPGDLLATTTVIETSAEETTEPVTSTLEVTQPETTEPEPTQPEPTQPEPTTVVTSTATPPEPTSAIESGAFVIVYVSDGTTISTETIETNGLMGTLTSLVEDNAEPTSPDLTLTDNGDSPQTDGPSEPTTGPGSAASKFTVGAAHVLMGVMLIMFML